VHLVQLRTQVEATKVKKLLGTRAKASDFGMLITEDATVFKPDGKRLVTLLRGALSEEAAASAYPFLHWLRKHTGDNRGNYGGVERFRKVKKDGTVSSTNRAAKISSVIAGHFDRYPRFPFCRETVFSTKRPEDWIGVNPQIREVAMLFAKHCPDRFAAQLAAAKATHPAYVLPGTPFTTLTVNNCVAGSYHKDAGDFEPGFGCMSVARKGSYRGCWLGFPAFGVAVDMQDRDLILFDPHEVHGNTPFEDIVGEQGEDWERISVVYYFRKKMLECLSPSEELARAKKIRGGELELPTLETEIAQ
jgi:hypothetical protein